jgi:hypothetical protein
MTHNGGFVASGFQACKTQCVLYYTLRLSLS